MTLIYRYTYLLTIHKVEKWLSAAKRKILTNQDNEPFCAAGVGMSCATIAGPWYLGRTSALV